MMSTLALTACKPDKVKSEPLLALALASSIRSAATGACILNVNAAGIYYGQLLFHVINNTAGTAFTRADYDLAIGKTGTATSAAEYNLIGYEEKYRAFFLNNGNWGTTQRNSRLATFKAAYDAGTSGLGATTAGVQQLVGTGIMACARIPRSSCSVTALTTATRDADVIAQTATYNAVTGNGDCRLPSQTFPLMLAKNLFRGLPSSITVALSTGNFTNTPTNGMPLTVASGTPSTQATIFPEAAYPKSAALVSNGFGNLMPINKLGTAYPTATSSTDTTAFYGGTNLTVTQVASCEEYGFSYGIAADASENLRKPLTAPPEIAYAFSTNGSAASAYAATIQLSTIDSDASAAGGTNNVTLATAGTIEDAVNCNNSFRARQGVSLALGGGKLPTTNGGAQSLANGDGRGDDRASSLLSICLYGNTSARRGTSRTILGGSFVPNQLQASSQLTTCGEGALANFKTLQAGVAHAFTEVGTINATSFPDTTTP